MTKLIAGLARRARSGPLVVRLSVALVDAARIIEELAPKNAYYEAKVREMRELADEERQRANARDSIK